MRGTVAIHVRYKIKPGNKERMREIIYRCMDHMQHEDDFVMATAHDSMTEPNEIFLYEIWNCTREKFYAEQHPKAYRQEYNEALQTLIYDRIGVWLTPDAEWGSTLTIHAGKRKDEPKTR